MKICYCGPVSLKLLSDLVDGGDSLPEGYAYPLGAYLIRSLRKAGIEVAVVSCWNDIAEPMHLQGDGIEIHALPRRIGLPLMFDAYGRERRYMVDAIRSTNSDFVHAQWTYEFAHAALDSGLPCLVTARDAPWEIARHSRSPYRVFRAIYSGHVLKRVRHLTVISPYLGERFLAMGCREDMHVVPNGLSLSLFTESTKLEQPVNGITFLSVTGWNRRKNPKALIRAFQKVRERIPDARLIVIGKDMEQGGPAKAWAAKNGLSMGITFAGLQPHDRIIELMRSSDIFVHSTREESFCMAILEAMAQRLPVVAFPGSGAVPWLLDYGRVGRIAGGSYWYDLADAMEELAGSRELREHLAEAGYGRARQHFTMDAIAKQYISLYQHILKRELSSD